MMRYGFLWRCHARATLTWEKGDTSRIPFAVYTDDGQHQKELQRFFYQSHWSYVGLEAEIANPGDFKRTVIGERSVIMTRALDGQIHVVENICAHRGMAFAASGTVIAKNWSAPTTSGATG